MSRRSLFGSLLALVFLVNLSRFVFAPLVEPMMSTFEVGPGVAGFVATLAWLGSALPRIPVGYVLTRVGRRHVIAASGVALVVATSVASVAPTIGLIGVAAVLMGLTSGAYFVAGNPLVSELYPDRIGRAIGVHGVSTGLATVAAAPLVGLALAFGGFRLSFVMIGGAAVAATAWFAAAARRTDLPVAGAADRDLIAAARAQWPPVLLAVVIVGTAGFVWNGVINFYVTYLEVGRGVPESTGRDFLTLLFAAGVPAFWIAGWLADRIAYVPLLLATVGGFAGSLFALTVANGPLAVAVASVAVGFTLTGLFPAVDTFLLDSLPDEHRASAYSVYSGTMMPIQALGSAFVGSLAAAGLAYGDVFRWLAVGLAGLVAMLVGLHVSGRVPTGRSAS